MEDLNKITAAELVALYNARCPDDDRIDGPWKKDKAELIARIWALGAAGGDETEADNAEETMARGAVPETSGDVPGATGTVRAFAEALLSASDGVVLTYEEIAQRIREAMPGTAPTPQSIRWYAAKMRKRGESVRVRYASRMGTSV